MSPTCLLHGQQDRLGRTSRALLCCALGPQAAGQTGWLGQGQGSVATNNSQLASQDQRNSWSEWTREVLHNDFKDVFQTEHLPSCFPCLRAPGIPPLWLISLSFSPCPGPGQPVGPCHRLLPPRPCHCVHGVFGSVGKEPDGSCLTSTARVSLSPRLDSRPPATIDSAFLEKF